MKNELVQPSKRPFILPQLYYLSCLLLTRVKLRFLSRFSCCRYWKIKVYNIVPVTNLKLTARLYIFVWMGLSLSRIKYNTRFIQSKDFSTRFTVYNLDRVDAGIAGEWGSNSSWEMGDKHSFFLTTQIIIIINIWNIYIYKHLIRFSPFTTIVFLLNRS